MKGRQRSKDGQGFVHYPAIRANPNGTRAERRAWEKLHGKRATTSSPAPTSAKPDAPA